jgi:homoserine O-acetyltransferase
MNTNNITRGRGPLTQVLRSIKVPTIVAGVTSDRLYPLYQQQQLADYIPSALPLVKIDSLYGHDGFLIETEVVGELVRQTLALSAN